MSVQSPAGRWDKTFVRHVMLVCLRGRAEDRVLKVDLCLWWVGNSTARSLLNLVELLFDVVHVERVEMVAGRSL